MTASLRARFVEAWQDEHGSAPPARWAICPDCEGHGTTTAHLGSYTESDRDEMGEEWFEFMADVRAGLHDRPCPECNGAGKVLEFSGPAADEFSEWCADEAADLRTRRAESGYFE